MPDTATMESTTVESTLRTRIRSAATDLQRAQREMRAGLDVGAETGRLSPLFLGAVEALLLAADSLIGEYQVATQ